MSDPNSAIPDPDDCRGPEDAGRLEYNAEDDVWYECSHDPRRDLYVWTIITPVE